MGADQEDTPEVSAGRKALAEALMDATLVALLTRVRSGDATAADLTAALKACQQNGVQQIPTANNPMGQLGKALTDTLPFAGTQPATYQ